jgi:hypothetical protein
VPVFGNVIGPYLDALDAKVAVFGWNRSAWRYTRKNIMEGVLALVKQVARPGMGR